MFCLGISSPRRVGTMVFACVGLFLNAPPPVVAAASEELDDLKMQADRWLELERRIADESNQWRTEKEIMTASLGVLRQEHVSLQGKLEANELAVTLFRERLEKGQADLGQQEASHRMLLARCDALEQRLRALDTRLPDPLREKLRPLFARLGRSAAEEGSAVADRTQALVSILAAIDQFNNTLTLVHQMRPGPGGELMDVKVLYWGLAAGYAIDARSENAWTLSPGAAGWDWRAANEHLLSIRTAVAIYEKQGNPEVVSLPVALKGVAP